MEYEMGLMSNQEKISQRLQREKNEYAMRLKESL